MSDLHGRTKMISVRLSDAEYRALKSQVLTGGAQSVSDLARLAIQRAINPAAGPWDDVTVKLQAMDTRLHTLEALVPLLLPERAKVSPE